MVLLVHLTVSTQLSYIQAAEKMAEEVSWPVDAANTELKSF